MKVSEQRFTVDSIGNSSLKICQPLNGFRFGTDSVLLSYFLSCRKKDVIIDIGAGSGIISALTAFYKKPQLVYAVELQNEMFECLKNTISLNDLEGSIKAIHSDINEYKPQFKFDVAVSNPPYRPVGAGKTSQSNIELNARFEQKLDLLDIIKFCKKYLKYKGKLFFCGDADRLTEAIYTCKDNGFEPKQIRFLHKNINSKGKLYFMQTVYGGGIELLVDEPFTLEGKGNSCYKNLLNTFLV